MARCKSQATEQPFREEFGAAAENVDIFANLVVKATVERVQKVVVGALLAVGVHDAVKVGEVPVQIHVVGILTPQEKIFAALEIGIKLGYFTVTVCTT